VVGFTIGRIMEIYQLLAIPLDHANTIIVYNQSHHEVSESRQLLQIITLESVLAFIIQSALLLYPSE